MVAAEWTPMEGLAEDILLPGVFEPAADPDDPGKIRTSLETRVIGPLEEFGLIEVRRVKHQKALDRIEEVQVSPLFWKFLTFELEGWDPGEAGP